MDQTTGIRTEFCKADINPEWDQFISSIPGISYEQSSLWALSQRDDGWKPARIILRRDNKIVCGVQILLLRLPLLGKFGYAPQGPCIPETERENAGMLVKEIKIYARQQKLQYLTIELPYILPFMAYMLEEVGFGAHPRGLPPQIIVASTVLVNLLPEPEVIMAAIKPGKRKNIQAALKKNVKVRLGSREDLPLLFDLVKQTCERRNVKPLYPNINYFYNIWDLFAPHDWVKLHIAETGGKAACASLSFTFGDTFKSTVWGWSAEHSRSSASEVMDWQTIMQAKQDGFRHYDFVQVDAVVAKALLEGGEIAEEIKQRPHFGSTFYKMRFGGDVVAYPGGFTYFPSRYKRFIFTRAAKCFLQGKLVKKVIRLIRQGRAGAGVNLIIYQYQGFAGCYF